MNFLKFHSAKCYLQETHFKYSTSRLVLRGWKKIYHASTDQNNWVASINNRSSGLQGKTNYHRSRGKLIIKG